MTEFSFWVDLSSKSPQNDPKCSDLNMVNLSNSYKFLIMLVFNFHHSSDCCIHSISYFWFVLRSCWGRFYLRCPSQDREERPLLPLCLVLRCHRFHWVHHHCIRPWGMEDPVLWPRSLVADADCCPGYRWPELPHEGPADRESRTRGLGEDCRRGAGIPLPVHFL